MNAESVTTIPLNGLREYLNCWVSMTAYLEVGRKVVKEEIGGFLSAGISGSNGVAGEAEGTFRLPYWRSGRYKDIDILPGDILAVDLSPRMGRYCYKKIKIEPGGS